MGIVNKTGEREVNIPPLSQRAHAPCMTNKFNVSTCGAH